MIPELGHFALIVALFIAIVLGTLPIVGAARGDLAAMSLARPAAQALFTDFLEVGHREGVPIIPVYDTGPEAAELIAERVDRLFLTAGLRVAGACRAYAPAAERRCRCQRPGSASPRSRYAGSEVRSNSRAGMPSFAPAATAPTPSPIAVRVVRRRSS